MFVICDLCKERRSFVTRDLAIKNSLSGALSLLINQIFREKGTESAEQLSTLDDHKIAGATNWPEIAYAPALVDGRGSAFDCTRAFPGRRRQAAEHNPVAREPRATPAPTQASPSS